MNSIGPNSDQSFVTPADGDKSVVAHGGHCVAVQVVGQTRDHSSTHYLLQATPRVLVKVVDDPAPMVIVCLTEFKQPCHNQWRDAALLHPTLCMLRGHILSSISSLTVSAWFPESHFREHSREPLTHCRMLRYPPAECLLRAALGRPDRKALSERQNLRDQLALGHAGIP